MLAIIALASIVASACGAANFDRADAITSLQTSGASAPEATCIADRLLASGQLDAADPRASESPENREALVLANQECLTVEVLPELELVTETTIPSAASNRPGGEEDEETSPVPLDPNDPALLELQRQSAISQLMSFGRSTANATCIVDQLIAAEAAHVLDGEQFGLGLDPAEAAAFAACL